MCQVMQWLRVTELNIHSRCFISEVISGPWSGFIEAMEDWSSARINLRQIFFFFFYQEIPLAVFIQQLELELSASGNRWSVKAMCSSLSKGNRK